MPLISPIAKARWVPFFSPLARGEDWKARLWGIAVLSSMLLPIPAFACADDEASLFSCIAQDQQHIIEVCAVRDDAAGGYQSVRYVYGTETAADLSFPADRRDGKAVLRFAHYFDKNVYNWSLRFDNKAYGYRVTSAGVEVSKKKKVIATVLCGVKPVMYPGDIRRATSCDKDNPFGAAGCSESAPAKK